MANSRECNFEELHDKLKNLLRGRIPTGETIEFCATTTANSRRFGYIITENYAISAYFEGFSLTGGPSGSRNCDVVRFEDVTNINEHERYGWEINLYSNAGGNHPTLSFSFDNQDNIYTKLFKILQTKHEKSRKSREEKTTLTPVERIEQLNLLLDKGFITNEEYETKRKIILANL